MVLKNNMNPDDVLIQYVRDLNLKNPENLVGMYDGKYTDSKTLYTSGLGGCTATLVYFESDTKKEGILTHFPPTNLVENVQKIEELKERTDKKPKSVSGILLVNSFDLHIESFSGVIRCLFPRIKLKVLQYDLSIIGDVSIDPHKGTWKSDQYGENSFITPD